jgi:anaerobic nitric oxide reductase transcription regulator
MERGQRVLILQPDLDVGGQRVAPTLTGSQATLSESAPPSLRDSVDAHQRDVIRSAVERNRGNWAAAARDLGVGRANLRRLARRLGLK